MKGFRPGKEPAPKSATIPPQSHKVISEGVLVAIPALDGRVDVLTIGGLIQAMAAGAPHVQPYFLMGNSDIRACRNHIAHYWLNHRKEYQHLVWIDSDIGFTLQDFFYLCEGPEDLVVAPYARKAPGETPNQFGFGFVRTHRRVFESLTSWDIDGQPALRQYTLKGELAWDFFVNGAMEGLRWLGEDTGFFHLCAARDIRPRLETRTRLKHVGRFLYGYPEQMEGFISSNAGAQ